MNHYRNMNQALLAKLDTLGNAPAIMKKEVFGFNKSRTEGYCL